MAREHTLPCLAYLWPWKPLYLLGVPAHRVVGPLAPNGKNRALSGSECGSSTGNVPWCQPCNNRMEHFLTLSHTCCQQPFASNLFKLHGGSRQYGSQAFSGSTAPEKAPQILCSCLGSGVASGNSCCVSIETRGLWEIYKGLTQNTMLRQVPGPWKGSLCLLGFLQIQQQQEQSRKKAKIDKCLLNDYFKDG